METYHKENYSMLNKNEMAACKKILKNDKVNSKFLINGEAIVCTERGLLLVFKRETGIDQQIQLNNETILSLTSLDSLTLLNDTMVSIYSGSAIYNARFAQSVLNYQRVIPDSFSGEAANFNTKYLNIIYELVKSENGTGYFKIQYNGSNPARVNINNTCFAIIAPLNFD